MEYNRNNIMNVKFEVGMANYYIGPSAIDSDNNVMVYYGDGRVCTRYNKNEVAGHFNNKTWKVVGKKEEIISNYEIY